MLHPWTLLSTVDFFDWKYLKMMLISFLDLAGRGGRGRALLIVTGTDFTISFLLLPLVRIVLGVNFEDIFDLSVLVFWSVLSYASPPVWKQRSRSETTSEPYKPAFHGGHLSRNTSYGSAATIQVFCLPQWRYSYSTQSSMTELLLSVSQH